MARRDARAAMREADAAFQSTPLPPEVLARMRRRTLAGRPSRAGWLMAVAAGVAAAVLTFVLWPRRAAVEVEDVTLAATQRYQHGRFDITASFSSVLHRDHEQLSLIRGDVTVSVAKHPEPVSIAVSGGRIEVVGTRFTIHETGTAGSVTLHEGVIHFVTADQTVVLAPQDTVEWPLKPKVVERPDVEPEPPPPLEPEAPPPHPRKHPRPHHEPAVIHETDAAWLLEEVDVARSRGEYAEAVRLLDKGLAGLVLPATRERFSFELGSLLTYQQGDPARACQQWAKHRAAFPNGRYAREVERATERLKCGSP